MKRKGYPSGYVPALIKYEDFLPIAVKHLSLDIWFLKNVDMGVGVQVCRLWLLLIGQHRGCSWPAVAHTFSYLVGQANKKGMRTWGRNRTGNKVFWSYCRSWKCGSKRTESWVLRGFLQWEERARTFKVKPSITHPLAKSCSNPMWKFLVRKWGMCCFLCLLWGVQEIVDLIFSKKLILGK